jgi:hypothetical protein
MSLPTLSETRYRARRECVKFLMLQTEQMLARAGWLEIFR